MKVIDLLNKIANGEEVPKKIKVLSNNEIFTYDNVEDDYISELNFTKLFRECIPDVVNLPIYLNDEVEIIVEDNKIENNFTYIYKIEDKKINTNFENIKSTLENIIDKINKMENK